MGLPSFGELHRRADQRAERVSLAVAGPADPSVLRALRVATDRGWVAPLLVGDAEAVRLEAGHADVDLDGFRLVDTTAPSAEVAVAEVRSGRAHVLMKGQVATSDLMRAVLDPETGLRSGRGVSQVVLMEITPTDRRFLMADTGVQTRPRLASKAEIVAQVVEVATALGLPAPRVALLAASETVSSSMSETLDAAELTERARQGAFAPAYVQGPLSFDLAYSPEAGVSKRVEGEVVGRADALVFPDLLSANLTVKAIMYTAQCQFGGILKGTIVPVAFMSRSDTPATRLNSLALALAMRES